MRSVIYMHIYLSSITFISLGYCIYVYLISLVIYVCVYIYIFICLLIDVLGNAYFSCNLAFHCVPIVADLCRCSARDPFLYPFPKESFRLTSYAIHTKTRVQFMHIPATPRLVVPRLKDLPGQTRKPCPGKALSDKVSQSCNARLCVSQRP